MSLASTEERTLVLPVAALSRDRDIVVVRVAEGFHQTMQDARTLLGAVASLAEGDRVALLIDLRKAKPLEPEVRQIYTGPEVEAYRAIGLLVETSPFGRVMGSFYLRVARLGTPTRIFTDEEAARAWLRS